LQWRRFNFFDKELVKDADGNEAFDKLKGVNLTACTYGRGQIVAGDSEGTLYFVNRHLELTCFKAYELCVTHLFQLKQHNILISVGEDEEGINPLVKVWNFDKIDRTGNPSCSRIVRAIPGNRPTKVTCLTVHENLNFMAIGFENGSVVLFRGDVMRERHSKQRVIYEGHQKITGLAFRAVGKNQVLFVVTEGEVVCITMLPKDKELKTVLDFHGCPLHCSAMSDLTQDNQFIIGRSDAVYFYQPDGRGPCLAFEGEKLQLYFYRGYMIIVGKENNPLPRGSGQSVEMNTVTVYDIQNKFIAYSAPFPEVISVFCEWGSLYVLAGDRKMYHLQEKDTQTKLELLFKKNLYLLAISLAQSHQYDQDGIVDICRQYGDHLYSKGDFDGAVVQYIKTIGRLEASYVIRKFLDTQRIDNLTAYLEALHKAQMATEDHTTLLLNCYTKRKDVTKLNEFIMTKDREVDFDVETAIRVCRSAGYYEHALFLADKHDQHDWYLRTQLEDIHDYRKALEYIAKLEFDEAEKNLKKYGKVLISEVPAETTELLKTLCTDYHPTNKPLIDSSELQGAIPHIQRANADEFIHIFVNNSKKLTEFLEHMVKVQPNSSTLMYNTLLELYLHDYIHESDSSAKENKGKKTSTLLQNPDAGYDSNQALVLCQMNDFRPGVLYLYEKMKLYQQILQYHMEHNDYACVIETCKRFGTQDSNLWVLALSYFAQKEEDCKQHLIDVLAHIDKRNLLPPLLVIQTLAHNSTATLAVVKDYVIQRLRQEREQISEDERLVNQYHEETEKMRTQIEQLRTTAKIFQNSKCSVCSHSLDLPSVHFLCQHSFHQHCFESYSESDAECPVCLPENRKLMDIIRAQEQSKDLHEQFHHQLERAQDGFSVIADYFGRGIFNKVTLVTDQPPQPRSASYNPFLDPTPQHPTFQTNRPS
jgi:hypothetical protein